MLHIVAMALPHNRGSRRVMEKTGFVYEREVIHAGLLHVLYRRAADDGAIAPGGLGQKANE